RVAGFLGVRVTAEMLARAKAAGLGASVQAGQVLGVDELDLCGCACEGDNACQDGCDAGCACREAGGCLCDGDYCECPCGLPCTVPYHFADADHQVRTVVFARLAVTETQIRDMGLPTRPTKQSDSRARGFHGGSVEVDAVPPSVLRQIVEDAITRHIDPEALRLTEVAEESERELLTRMRGQAS